MDWGQQQIEAIQGAIAWQKSPMSPQVYRIFGLAGTGKTTIANYIAEQVKGTVLYAAYTGKAAMVLRQKGCRDASTIHSLIYKVDERAGRRVFVLNMGSPLVEASLLIVDEVSMVDEDLARDLLSFGVKILVLGDPFQLPPISGTGFFTHNPAFPADHTLTEIHRQAENDPIIHLSMMARSVSRIRIRPGKYGESLVIKRDDVTQDMVMSADQILVGANRTRVGWNNRIRSIMGMQTGIPASGDKVVCLKNNSTKGFFNGQTWTVLESIDRGDYFDMELSPIDDFGDLSQREAKVRKDYFVAAKVDEDPTKRDDFDQFTFGYCLTVHKSQGSAWPYVLVNDESFMFNDAASRWLYTAITRSSRKLVLVQS